MPGRQIVDNVVVAFESMHSLANCHNGKKGWMSLKLDMSKAYNRVEWCFLLKLDMSKANDRVEWCFLWVIMQYMGFDSRWIGLVMSCIVTPQFSVVLNGIPKRNIVPSRGL